MVLAKIGGGLAKAGIITTWLMQRWLFSQDFILIVFVKYQEEDTLVSAAIPLRPRLGFEEASAVVGLLTLGKEKDFLFLECFNIDKL